MSLISSESSVKEVELADTKSPAEIEEDAALQLVKSDAESAMNWLEAQQWNENWRTIDLLYDSPRQFAVWEGSSTTPQPAINRFILCQHVNSIHPQIVEGVFSEAVPFEAEPRPGTEAETVRARTAVLSAQLDEMDFKIESDLGIFQQVLHGTGIWKWGLKWCEEEFSEFKRKAPPMKKADPLTGEEITINSEVTMSYEEKREKRKVLKPFFEQKDIRNILVDPKLKFPDIRKARFVIEKSYVTLADLLEMKAGCDAQIEAGVEPDYDLPDEDTLKSWFEKPAEQPMQLGNLDPTPGAPSIAGQGQPDWMETSEDPYQDCLMVLERWDNFKVITTLNNKKVIQNRKNPYGIVSFYSCNYYNRIRSFHGIGLGKIVGTDQRLQQGLENAGLSLLQLLMDPPFAISDDSFVPTQNVRFRKGGFIKVKGDVRQAIAPLQMPNLPVGELFAFLQNSEAKAEAAGGANELFTQGAMPGPGTGGKSSATRTSGGANLVAGAAASRLQGPVERFVNQVFIPWIYQLDELNRRFLMTTPEGMAQIKQILGDELGPNYKFDEDKFMSGRVVFDVLAGANLAAKKIMAQSMPILTQIFDNPMIQQQLNQIGEEYVDIKELLLMWMQAIGFTNRKSLIKKMSEEQKQRQAANNPAVQKQQSDQQKLEGQTEAKSKLQSQKSEEGITRDVISESLKQGGTALLREGFEKAPENLGA